MSGLASGTGTALSGGRTVASGCWSADPACPQAARRITVESHERTRPRSATDVRASTPRPHMAVHRIDQMWTEPEETSAAVVVTVAVSVVDAVAALPVVGRRARALFANDRPAWTGPDETAGERRCEHDDHEGVLHAVEPMRPDRYDGTADVGRAAPRGASIETRGNRRQTSRVIRRPDASTPDTRRTSAPMAEPRPYDERVVGARPVDAESSEGSRRVSAGGSEANEARRAVSAELQSTCHGRPNVGRVECRGFALCSRCCWLVDQPAGGLVLRPDVADSGATEFVGHHAASRADAAG